MRNSNRNNAFRGTLRSWTSVRYNTTPTVPGTVVPPLCPISWKSTWTCYTNARRTAFKNISEKIIVSVCSGPYLWNVCLQICTTLVHTVLERLQTQVQKLFQRFGRKAERRTWKEAGTTLWRGEIAMCCATSIESALCSISCWKKVVFSLKIILSRDFLYKYYLINC